MTHPDAENERIAEFLGLITITNNPAQMSTAALECGAQYEITLKGDLESVPNFLTDESASAILRDAMLAAGYSIWLFDDHYRLYRNDADSGPVQVSEGFADNARLAIVECFKWMQAKGGRG